MLLSAEDAAFADAIELETPYKNSLDGIWKTSLAGNPDLRVKDFWRTDFPDGDRHEIDVPSCVEKRGFGSPGYTNVRYPHKMEWPFIRDRQSGKADYNPVSSYRRRFTMPEDWKGREVFLRFDGVYSAYYVWVNGERAGYAEDSKLPSEFNVTKYLKDGENLLAVEVYRWCDGSYLEDQDMTRFSGIFRDVALWSMPKGGIWDFAVKTDVLTRRNGGAEPEDWRLSVEGIDGDWTAVLYDAEKKPVARLSSGGAGRATVAAPNLWSAEKPYLYTLIVKKGGDIRARRVGFKEVRVSGNALLVNGRKVKFKGVNRHETSPDNGRTVSLEDMVKDVALMKKHNIDTVRTSHYPNHRLWYDLCDRYGIYLCAEANVEAHEPGYGEKGLGKFPEWKHSIVERNLRHVAFYRNHPSVAFWSMGNETAHGICFKEAISEVKKLDPPRPVHWERGNPDADFDSKMHPRIEWLEERGRFGDPPRGSEAPGIYRMTDADDANVLEADVTAAPGALRLHVDAGVTNIVPADSTVFGKSHFYKYGEGVLLLTNWVSLAGKNGYLLGGTVVFDTSNAQYVKFGGRQRRHEHRRDGGAHGSDRLGPASGAAVRGRNGILRGRHKPVPGGRETTGQNGRGMCYNPRRHDRHES